MIFQEVKPEVIIELGSGDGGSAVWMADICQSLGLDTKVISLDIEMPRETHPNVTFKEFDLIITEGLHYPLLYYLLDYNGKILFNDSITLDKMFTPKKIFHFNSNFKNHTSVLVNNRIKKLYEKQIKNFNGKVYLANDGDKFIVK